MAKPQKPLKTPKGGTIKRSSDGKFCQTGSKPWDTKKSNVAGRRNKSGKTVNKGNRCKKRK